MAALTVKRLDAVRSAPTEKVLKGADYQHLVAAEAAVVEVERNAEALFERTRQAAIADSEAEAEAIRKEVLLDATLKVVDYLGGLEARIAGLVADGVARVIGQLEPSEATVRMIDQLLHEVHMENSVKVRVAVDDLRAVAAQVAELKADHPNIKNLEVAADPRLAKGSCRLETPLTILETSLEEQIESLRAAMASAFGDAAGPKQGPLENLNGNV